MQPVVTIRLLPAVNVRYDRCVIVQVEFETTLPLKGYEKENEYVETVLTRTR